MEKLISAKSVAAADAALAGIQVTSLNLITLVVFQFNSALSIPISVRHYIMICMTGRFLFVGKDTKDSMR